ncbi:ATP-binding cassette domain-containing protein [Alteromonas gracilis]|uniref:ATP-binding cassette domain-containing protein n=1 Tax=Alteromonas gracilis TaxID=1479524 RepID=UPI0037361F6A
MQISALLPHRIDAQIELQPHSSFIGVTGPSGAGKSSLFRALAGVENTAKVTTPWMHKKVGIVFQQPMLFPHTNVRGNLALAQRHAGPNALTIEACLRGCFCEHLIDKPVQALSGGEAQRVAIARALVNGPDVLLLDESLSAIDIFTRRKIYQFLHDLCVSGQLSCFVISHDLDDLALFSDELIYINQGRVEVCGKTRDVLAQVFEKEGVITPSSVLEGVKAAPLENVEYNQDAGAIERVTVAGHEVFVTQESMSYVPIKPSDETLVRFAVKACDVSIDINTADFNNTSTVSILNALPCVISSIEPVRYPSNPSGNSLKHKAQGEISQTQSVIESGKVLLKLALTDSHQSLYASISVLSLSRLNLHVGMKVIARFKLP